MKITIEMPPDVRSYWRKHKNIIICENCETCFKILFPNMYERCPRCQAVMDREEETHDSR